MFQNVRPVVKKSKSLLFSLSDLWTPGRVVTQFYRWRSYIAQDMSLNARSVRAGDRRSAARRSVSRGKSIVYIGNKPADFCSTQLSLHYARWAPIRGSIATWTFCRNALQKTLQRTATCAYSGWWVLCISDAAAYGQNEKTLRMHIRVSFVVYLKCTRLQECAL